MRNTAENYRQRRVGASYLAYYYIAEQDEAIFIIDVRHQSQRPLKASTLRKYKGEIETS